MELSSRQANAVLVALALAAVGTSGYAMWSARQMPEPSSGTVQSAESTSVSTDGATTDAEPGEASETSEDQPQTGEDEPEESRDPETSPSATETTEQGSATSVNGWEAAWSEDGADLLVIGDGYSNLTSQWVQVWAATRAEERPTLISHWGEAADESFNEPIELSDASGPSLHVWSASRDGSSIADATERIDRFIGASASPDAVLISLGGSSGSEDVANQLDELLSQLPDSPVLVAAGPAELYSSGVADAIAAWAQDNSNRVALIDLREATSENPTAEEWALAFERAVEDA